MGFSCILSGHTWDGYVCKKCGAARKLNVYYLFEISVHDSNKVQLQDVLNHMQRFYRHDAETEYEPETVYIPENYPLVALSFVERSRSGYNLENLENAYAVIKEYLLSKKFPEHMIDAALSLTREKQIYLHQFKGTVDYFYIGVPIICGRVEGAKQ